MPEQQYKKFFYKSEIDTFQSNHCQNCILQAEKWACGSYENMYDYCPLKLFSNDIEKRKAALLALFKTPHNNLQVGFQFFIKFQAFKLGVFILLFFCQQREYFRGSAPVHTKSRIYLLANLCEFLGNCWFAPKTLKLYLGITRLFLSLKGPRYRIFYYSNFIVLFSDPVQVFVDGETVHCEANKLTCKEIENICSSSSTSNDAHVFTIDALTEMVCIFYSLIFACPNKFYSSGRLFF